MTSFTEFLIVHALQNIIIGIALGALPSFYYYETRKEGDIEERIAKRDSRILTVLQFTAFLLIPTLLIVAYYDSEMSKSVALISVSFAALIASYSVMKTISTNKHIRDLDIELAKNKELEYLHTSMVFVVLQINKLIQKNVFDNLIEKSLDNLLSITSNKEVFFSLTKEEDKILLSEVILDITYFLQKKQDYEMLIKETQIEKRRSGKTIQTSFRMNLKKEINNMRKEALDHLRSDNNCLLLKLKKMIDIVHEATPDSNVNTTFTAKNG
jgi:cell division protein FtsB